jgi:hypothetical protein
MRRPRPEFQRTKVTTMVEKMKHVRVNIRAHANITLVRRETRDGRDVIVVPSATLPDNIVMNNIMYPADEIEKGYKSLERSPAPYGHPLVGNQFVSAKDPVGINIGWIGAWNENVRRENGRVLLDKMIDVAVANQSEHGKAVLTAIDKGEPIDTSTGLYCDLEDSGGATGYTYIARNMEFDHDAILIGQEGAARPSQGVGMMVNAKGEPEEIEVINSAVDAADQDLDWAIDSLARALDKRQKAPLLDRLKSAILEAFGGSEGDTTTTTTNEEKANMAVDDKQFEALSAKVNTLSESVNKIGDTITKAVGEAIKPLTDNIAKMETNQKAKDEAEKAALVNSVVKANVLSEAAAQTLSLDALRELANKAKPGKAAPLNAAYDENDEKNPWRGFNLNAAAVKDAGEKETE